jgi:DNA polymerase I
MKSRFYLLDANEAKWEGKPCIRFWGVDEKGTRICIICNQILPYFYFLPNRQDDLEGPRKRIIEDKARFPGIFAISIETKKRLGRECNALKITCAESDVKSIYSKELRKLFDGESFENDLRLSVRYMSDLMLTPCGWNDCEADEMKLENVAAYVSYLASTAPRSFSSDIVPELRILAFHTLTVGGKGSAKPESDPVRAIAIATSKARPVILVSEKNDANVLKDFVEYVSDYDPDIIVGFQSNTQDWLYLIGRAKVRGFKLALGRDSSEPHTSVYGHVSITGRANLDLFDVASGIAEVKVKTLENVAKYLQLDSKTELVTFEEWDKPALWADDEGRRKLIENTKMAAQVSLRLAEVALNFPMQFSALTGMPLDQVMAAATGFRVDSYLIRQAHQIGELVPERREQPFLTYRGAIVLEPKTGLHDNVVVIDFASMYPALMEKYNLSPDTFVQPGENIRESSVFTIPEVNHRFRKRPDGFYKTVLSRLIHERSSLKSLLETTDPKSTRHTVLKERERTLKIITNACYGYAGWAGARWYVREVAESAAALGREAITKTVAKAESLGLSVIYGDTDSVFVKNDPVKVKQLLNWVKAELGLEIRVEKEYRRILFTEAMKRYAGLLPDDSLDIVGLEVIRGDWSDIARQVQEEVLKRILMDQSPERAVEAVRATIRRLQKGEVPIADLTIRKTLTKPIEKYAVRAPHVEVARRLMKEGWTLTVGDKVAYVITKGSGRLFEKAKPSSQVKPDEIDREYYLQNQVKPAAMRILERFGVEEAQLVARQLGDQRLPAGS